jgi:hypothetical protein
MTYKYYKFPNKESMPPRIKWPKNASINEIGIMPNNDAVYDEKGIMIVPPTAKSGWHVNVCYQEPIDLDFIKEYEIDVRTPRRTWLGQKV